MTIPAYLTALADLCDKHGTHAKDMGPELRLLAGLPWEQQNECKCEPDAEPDEDEEEDEPTHYKRTCAACGTSWDALHCPHEDFQNPCPECGKKPEPLRAVTPADIARAFLVCSRAPGPIWEGPHMLVNGRRYNAVTERAAACAELAVLSAGWVHVEQLPDGMEEALSDDLATMVMRPRIKCVRHTARPHDGTTEGARAAWGWIPSQLLVVESLGRAGRIFSTDPTRPFDAAFQNKIADGARVYAETYRRELEAMK